MRKKLKNINESYDACVSEAFSIGDNTLRNVKILGFISRNNRIYERGAVEKALKLYESAIVNIDHPKRDGARDYKDVFGRIHDVYMGDDGIYGNLTYNPAHPLAESFKWWASNDPSAIGLSHNADAKTKYNADGFEVIHEIHKINSVDIVSSPGTTNGLFEHYNKTLENTMAEDKQEDLVRKLDKGTEIKMEKDDEDKKDDDKKEACWDGYERVPGTQQGEDGSCRKKEGDMDFFEKKEGKLSSYVSEMKSKFMEVVGDEDKVLKLIDMLDLKEESFKEAEDDKDDKDDEKKESSHDKDDEKDDPKKAEESLRATATPGVKRLLEELDNYRVKAKRDELMAKAKDECAKNGLPTYAITECFLDTLISSETNNWSRLFEDRKKVVFHTKSPISTGNVESKLTVDSLVKALTQE